METLAALEPVWAFEPASPILGEAALLGARAYLDLAQPAQAVALLRRYAEYLRQPAGWLLLGKAAEAAGETSIARTAYHRVFYDYPLSPESAEASAGLRRAGDTAEAAAIFRRAEVLRRAGRTNGAKQELLAAASRLRGRDRELALVRAHTGDYRALSKLHVADAEAAAERLYLMHAAARRNSRTAQAEAALRELDRNYPKSAWTREALTSWGNHYLLRNDVAQYERLFKTCATRFAADPRSVYCHWKLAWSAWMRRDAGARRLLEEHLKRYPESDKSAAALYFLGRRRELQARYPLSYYSTLVEESPGAETWPDPRFTPNETTTWRIGRALQLERAGYADWAELELRYVARQQPYVAAMELAESATRRGAYDQALRFIKSLAKDYLLVPLEAAPQRFWKLAFPLPFAETLVMHCMAQDLDPNLVAALIRQESEFNPHAVSRANAYGLTQVLPSTGRALSRRLGIPYFRPAMLFEPDTNLKLGTLHLRDLLDANSGRAELSLAAYNAGQSRVREWQSWYEYREAAEFAETIPFSETRTYVQVVLRNAHVYRRLYGADWPLLRATR